jgi:hypothetical protein
MSAERIPQLSDDPPNPPRRPVTLYYRRNGVQVTSRHLSVGGERYELAELTEITRTRGTVHPGVVVGLVTAGAEAVILAPLGQVMGMVGVPVAWLLAGIALLIPCVVGFVCARRWPAEYELIGWYRGHQLALFATRDEREFGQVTRALCRALEAYQQR